MWPLLLRETQQCSPLSAHCERSSYLPLAHLSLLAHRIVVYASVCRLAPAAVLSPGPVVFSMGTSSDFRRDVRSLQQRLDGFVIAQNTEAAYSAALRELQAGCKEGPWACFIFPTLPGLQWRSEPHLHFALYSTQEAQAYLQHPVLGPRLTECTEAVLQHLKGGVEGGDGRQQRRSAVDVLGPVDAYKFLCSMRLFAVAANRQPDVFSRALKAFH